MNGETNPGARAKPYRIRPGLASPEGGSNGEDQEDQILQDCADKEGTALPVQRPVRADVQVRQEVGGATWRIRR